MSILHVYQEKSETWCRLYLSIGVGYALIDHGDLDLFIALSITDTNSTFKETFVKPITMHG